MKHNVSTFFLVVGATLLVTVSWVSLVVPVYADEDDICVDIPDEDECEEAKEKAEERKEAQEEAEKLSKKIEKEEERLEAHQEALNAIQNNLSVTVSQARQLENTIEATEETISRKEGEIGTLEKRLALQREVLSGLLRNFYITLQTPLAGSFAQEGAFVRSAQAKDHGINMQERIGVIMTEVKATRSSIEQEKGELEEVKEEKESLLSIKEQQAAALSQQRDYQATKVASSEAKVRSLNSRLSSIRSILSGFLGSSYTIDDVVDAVKDASKETGVRKEFLFAMLDKETDLGRFTGGCYYKNSKMGSTNETYFKQITKSLGYDYKKVKVSCPLSYGIGGAMGVAQFMPSTWMGYKDEIAKETGHNPPDPWSLEDGIMGMAIKLKRAGGDEKSGEHRAAAIYYCGSRLGRTVCQNYANTVTSWANGGYDDFF